MRQYRSHAKLNLHLDVLARRGDGYHNIETIFQTVALHDALTVAPEGRELVLTCDHPDLPCDDRNLVIKAANLLRRHTGCSHGARLALEKRIPVAAGLAGGSGNAAAALLALNDVWQLGVPDDDLYDVAAALGSDVPYCLVGGTVAATGRGEVLTALDPLPTTWFVLLHPQMALSAAAVYNSPNLEKNLEPVKNGATASFARAKRALASLDWPRLVFNRMETAVFPDHPELAELKQSLLSAGCVAAAMSGSGPTIFGVCTSQSHAEDVASRFSSVPTSVTHSVDCGVVCIEEGGAIP